MHSKVSRNFGKFFLCNGKLGCSRFYSNHIPRRSGNKFETIMPKDKQQVLAMQRQREKLKQKSLNYTATNVTLQILGSGARGAPRSLYVSTDHAKYMFNCGEGTQRLSYEHHLRLGKMENIFVTTTSWKNMGGLPGMALTVQDNGVPHIRIHGPQGCSDIFRGIERFVMLKDLTVSEAACKEDEPFVDNVMSVRYVMLSKPSVDTLLGGKVENIPVDDTNHYIHTINRNGKRPSSPEQSQPKLQRTEDLIKGDRILGSMAYICKLQPKAGSLMLDKCVDKGIKPGPQLGLLKAGQDITLPDGTVVLSSEVCSPMDPGPTFIVLECPEEEYLDSLLSCEAFAKLQALKSNEDDAIKCVVHFTPERVLQDPRYRRWMEKFDPTTLHIIINEENRCTGSEAIHRIQHKLHLLHPTIFPFLSEEGITVDDTKVNSTPDSVETRTKSNETLSTKDQTTREEFPLIHRVKTLDAVHLRPLNGFDTSGEFALTPRAYIDEAFTVEGFLDSLAELQTKINAQTKNMAESSEYPKIVMLGTGSSIPNKTRNTSGILLRIDEDNSMILDCGEGTAGQLVRFYGRTEVDKVLASIKVIYVSHLHADHHIGLIGLLNERERVTKQPVRLLAPEQIGSWLRIYNRRFENIADKFDLIPNKDLDLVKPILTISQNMRLQQSLEGIKFSTVRVKHCTNSFGISITLKNGYKIVYSGDTMPCDALVELGADSDLLIHEATMEDDLEREAKRKYHSTTSQAIDIGERMKAKFILLTHFSQRYSKLPHFRDNGRSPNLSRVGIAYDNMQISVSQLSLLPLMYPALNIMFSEFRVSLEEKIVKRQMRLAKEMRERELDTQMRQELP